MEASIFLCMISCAVGRCGAVKRVETQGLHGLQHCEVHTLAGFAGLLACWPADLWAIVLVHLWMLIL